MYCSPIILCLLNCINESIQVTESRTYFHRGSDSNREPHVCLPSIRLSFHRSSQFSFSLRTILVRFLSTYPCVIHLFPFNLLFQRNLPHQKLATLPRFCGGTRSVHLTPENDVRYIICFVTLLP